MIHDGMESNMADHKLEEFYFPVKIISGTDATLSVIGEMKRLGWTKPLLVTDKGIVAAGLLERILEALHANHFDPVIFDRVQSDPDTAVVEEAALLAKSEGIDGMIAFGGGSSIDAAKAAGILVTNKGKISDYEGVIPHYPSPPLPVITIPTTAGTGSEISSAAIITDKKRNFKMVIKSASGQTFAKTAILDPKNLVGIPPGIAAETGVDALSHALEASVSLNATFLTDAIALRAIHGIFKNLRKFVADTSDLTAAHIMLNSSCLAGISMTTGGLGLVHAMAHPLGAYAGISHGLACGLLLPHVLRHNFIARMERYAEVALAANPFTAQGFSGERSMASKLLDEVDLLLQDLHFPRTLTEIGISLQLTDRIVNDAVNSYLSKINPRMTSREEVAKLFEKVL